MVSQGKRTHSCGDLRAADVGTRVRLSGWVDSRRDLGALVFVDLRDRYGITQVAFDEEVADALRATAGSLKSESVIHVTGTVRTRPDGMINRERATGEVEVLAEDLEVLSVAATPPFEMAAEGVSDELRLQYRYLDLRRQRSQRALGLRHKLFLALRNELDRRGFLEIETPILTKATPEGARDYLVPSRVHPGKLFALPQSPQIFKQILMVSGADKYFQIVRCFRDEDLRADRQPEFTQLDLEMSFVDEQIVWDVVSEVVAGAVEAVAPDRKPTLPLPIMTWTEAMERFGTDKPDTRFAVELKTVGQLVKDSEFGVFSGTVKNGGTVRMLAVPGGASFSRKQISGLEDVAKDHGAKGLAWNKVTAVGDGAEGSIVLEGGCSKFLSPAEAAALVAATGAGEGDLLLAVADSFGRSAQALSAVRLAVGKALDLIDTRRLDFLWIIEFPMFDRDEETGQLSPAHHPFCMPKEEYEGQLEQDPAGLLARSYDLVLNGTELGSGSVRIHDSAQQERVFSAIGLPDDEIQARFGFVLEAFRYGTPPHAGFAVGLDRLVMLLAGEESIREVIAFPKTATAACLMTGAPTTVPDDQLAEAGMELSPAARARLARAEGAAPGGASDAGADSALEVSS